MTEEEYWFWLCNVGDMYNAKMSALIKAFKSPEGVFLSDRKKLTSLGGIKPDDADNIIESRYKFDAREELAKLKEKGVIFIYPGSMEYPERLLVFNDRPLCLFVKGKIPDENRPTVGIVGARRCSAYGSQTAMEIAYELAGAGVQVISGMAAGIDSFAHKGAINALGDTYAVLGNGVDICYPRANIELYMQIARSGGIISEYIPGAPPVAWHFPQRNRIISGLSDVLVIVEAKEKSGSLITAEWALEQGKDVYAVPGRINEELSRGCNRLIRSGAAIVTCAQDILDELGIWMGKKQILKKTDDGLAKNLKVVYSCVDLSPKHIHFIIEETGCSSEEISGALLELEMLGLVEETAKDYYVKKV